MSTDKTNAGTMGDLRAWVEDFGGDPSALRLLKEDSPELLPYATLMVDRRNDNAILDIVEGVYEWQGAPLAFLVDANSLENDDQLHRIRRLLAMRGDAPYVAVMALGRLDVYSVALDGKSMREARVNWEDVDNTRATVFARLGNMRPNAAYTNQNWISNVVLRLLTGSMTTLIDLGLSDEDAISLVGRALFTRFLADRNLLPGSRVDVNTATDLFDTREMAENTSKWLDETFNGDLLPLSARTFDMVPKKGYHVLGDILRKAPNSQLFLGWKQKWDNLDFAHIPVGVLSQAYEIYLRKYLPKQQKHQGGYFTPKPIAELMVQAAFRALRSRETGKLAKILDPAVGGGIFLLTAFRELVAEHWRADGRRPDTNTLRRILYNQLVGFDVNESALRFAALGLYLLTIELDANPKPIEKLRFDDLRGVVLHRVKREDEDEGKSLGSLGSVIGQEHAEKYDLVIGNPPWASSTGLPKWKDVRTIVERIASNRQIANTSPPLPNQVLDLPFVWRAMEWAKPEGQIAFALHARLLFQQGNRMPAARQTLFDALDITSIINCVELRQTNVWPQISAPFCILFATNRKPSIEGGFRFISPRIEQDLNKAGSMRIDARNADIVSVRQLQDTPDVLKILFRGTKADLAIVERMRLQGNPTLAKFWEESIGVGERGQLRGTGSGYQKLRPSSRPRPRRGDGQVGANASYLHGIPEITVKSVANIFVERQFLEEFKEKRIHDPRSPDLFVGPLLAVHQSPSAMNGRIGVTISQKDIVYNETFYGYSPINDCDAELLVRYLALILGSKMTIWWALITSGKFGFERDVVEKATLDRMPFPDFKRLTVHQRREINRLVEGLHTRRISWVDVDEWVLRLYGFSDRDRQVISDTLEFGLPFTENKQKAQSLPTSAEKDRFCKVLEDELEPWCKRFGSAVAVDQNLPWMQGVAPWQVVRVRNVNVGSESIQTVAENDWAAFLKMADEAAATEILIETERHELLVGRLAQRRYWSETQARLLAQQIIWSHLELLKG